jgi:hypothetical protein
VGSAMRRNHDLSGIWQQKVKKPTFMSGIVREGQIIVG